MKLEWSVLQGTWGTMGVTPVEVAPQWKVGLVVAVLESRWVPDLAWVPGVWWGRGVPCSVCEDGKGLLRDEEAHHVFFFF